MTSSPGATSASCGGGKGGKGGGGAPSSGARSAEISSFEAMILLRRRERWRRKRCNVEELRGCVFAGCVFSTASTVFFGGGRGDERQTRKHTFFLGS